MSDDSDFPSGEPLLVEPMKASPVMVDPVEPVASVAAVVPLTSSLVRRSYARSVAPDAIVATLVGLFVLLVGLLAVTRGGFDGPMDTPVVSVLGFSHTTTLGLIEVVVGGSLLISGATRSRSAALFFGSILGIAAFVGAVQTESFQNNLALESGFVWLMVIGGLMVVLAEVLLPRYLQRSTVVYPL